MKIQNSSQLSQTQNLAMTPRLQQAIKLLQMNNLELAQYLRAEINVNPLLEFQQTEAESSTQETNDFDDFHDDTWDYYNNDERPDFEQNIKVERSLSEYLKEQLNASELNDSEKKIGEYLIYQLSGNGYLEDSIEDLAAQIGAPLKTLEHVLKCVKNFDPVGVFSHSISEHLTIQLQDKGMFDDVMSKLMENLSFLTEIDFSSFCQKIGLTSDECAARIKLLRTLTPYPSYGFAGQNQMGSVVPEVTIYFDKGEELVIELNEEMLPKVLINQKYLTDIRLSVKTKEEKHFVTEQYNHANWIMNALLQRSQNMLLVCRAIAERQRLFFKQGISALRPLTLKDLAKDTGLHESTVSRLTTGRFISTPMGTLDAKFFFSQSLRPEKNLVDISARSVQDKLQKFVTDEDKTNPLSDDELAVKLSESGINVARRTISKYRKQLKIMSSHERRHAYVRKKLLGD